jgi:probable DNA metabolism protein
MIEAVYDGTLAGLFAVLDKVCRGTPLPDRVCPSQGRSGGIDEPDGGARELYEFSADAYDAFVHGWMSEFPIEGDLIRFAGRVIAAGRRGGRREAERAATDRGDPATASTLTAAYKARREIDRMMGFLRFVPDEQGVYTARCAPDHYVLPGLGDHFARRFGDIPWTIIDEKRGLALGTAPEEVAVAETAPAMEADPWEDLWRNYHRSINNEGRKNPGLQRKLMPIRYWPYLSEMKPE